MESVEYLMVAVAAYLIVVVNESVVDIESRNELRKYTSVLGENGLESFKLRLLLTVNPYSVSVLDPVSDIFCKKFEILVEYWLRGNVELDYILILTRQRKFHIYIPELLQSREESPLLVHIGRIHPYQGTFRKYIRKSGTIFLVSIRKVRINIYTIHLLLGKLGVRIEYIDGLDFISEKGDSERIVERIGKNINQGTSDSKLPRLSHEVYPFESVIKQCGYYIIV